MANSSSSSHYIAMSYRNSTAGPLICFPYSMMSTSTVWKGQNPLVFTYPLLLLDILIIILTSRATAIVLKPLHQPRFVSELLSGILLGPSAMGRVPHFSSQVFPLRMVLILETLAYLGVVYFIFIVAVELDLTVVQHSPGRSTAFACVCMLLPFIIGASYGTLTTTTGKQLLGFLTFLSVALSVTAFSVLARTLAELKLLNTTVGATALSAAVIVDACSWTLVAIAIALVQNAADVVSTLWTAVTGTGFVVVCMTVVRPALEWVAKQTQERDEVDEFHACAILIGVLVSAVIGDVIGIHAVSGAFMFGLIIPNGQLGTALIEMVEDFVEGMLLPLFFAICGLRTNLDSLFGASKGAMLLPVVVISAALSKIGGCLLVGYLNQMSKRDGLLIGLLMNSKGIMEVVILNIGIDKRVLDEPCFTVLVFMSIAITAIQRPLLRLVMKQPDHRVIPHRRRTVQWPNPDSELRMLVCIHSPRNVSSMIGLIEVTNPTKRAPIFLYALHLIQLTGRASAMLTVHKTTTSRNSRQSGGNAAATPSDHIMHAFEIYEQHAGGVSVQHLTAVSPYSTMHMDICAFANNHHAAVIILPFHKQQTVDGGMEVTNPALRSINQNVLDSAPCSVGILVDRGLGGALRLTAGRHAEHNVALIFLGGPDDREALAYAARMAEHPGVGLTVLRIAPGEPPSPKAARLLTVTRDSRLERERQLDAESISEFQLRYINDESVVYDERVACNSEETMEVIRSMDSIHDLYIVGRGLGVESPLTAGLNDWSECPELGPIGDVLTSSDFAGTASVLVVHRCPTAVVPPRMAEPESSLGKKMKVSPSRAKVFGI